MATNEDLPLGASSCFQHFGFEDFALARVKAQHLDVCPIKTCSTTLTKVRFGKGERPFCPTHGLRLHSNTFVYWNGIEKQNEARLRNFQIRPDLAREIALGSVAKAESHRLGHEMSEDALTWNVFVGLAEVGKLRQVVYVLTGRKIDAEPDLYLWGELIDVRAGRRERFQPLDAVRECLEKDIKGFKTEPDAMLVIEGELIVCLEAKFGSGNPLAYEGTVPPGQKPVGRAGLLRRYLDKAGAKTRESINRSGIGETFHSQLFRNVVFASEMASSHDWHVVNLASSTQWTGRHESKRYSFKNPEEHIRSYLQANGTGGFSFRTWEDLHGALIKDAPALQMLDTYVRSKSAHYRQALDLE